MGLVGGSYGIEGPPHRMVGWISESTPFGKYDVLRPLLRNADSLLDVGCGTGMLVEWLMTSGCEGIRYVGVDLSKKFLSTLRDRFPTLAESVVHQNALEPLPEGQFDVVTSFGLTSDLSGYAQVGKLLQNVCGSCRDVAVVEFWDKDLFKVVGNGIPPASWDPQEVLGLCEELCPEMQVDLIHPLYRHDFAIVMFKG